MKISNNDANEKRYIRTIWPKQEEPRIIQAIDQRWLPHEVVIEDFYNVGAMAVAIKEMHVRGAGLIGAAAGYGMYLASLENSDYDFLVAAGEKLKATRPTAVNLEWAVQKQLEILKDINNSMVLTVDGCG